MNADELLDNLLRCVAAEPAGPDGKKPQLCIELVSRLKALSGSSGVSLQRETKRKLAALPGEFRDAAGDATRLQRLNRHAMIALPGSSGIIEALKLKGAGERLEAEAIVKDEQIWIRLGGNDKGQLDNISGKLHLPPSTVLDILTEFAVSNARKSEPGSLARFDGLFLTLFCLAIAAVAVVCWPGLRNLKASQVAIVRDVRPFEPIGSNDVVMQTTWRRSGAFSRTADVVGRYTAAALPKGSIPVSTDLSASDLPGPMANRSVVQLPLKWGKSAPPKKLPVVVTLLVSPRHPGTASLVAKDSWILAMQDTTDSTLGWIAVDSSLLPPLAAALGDSDVFVAQP